MLLATFLQVTVHRMDRTQQLPDPELKAHVRAMVERYGAAQAAKELGLSRATIANFLADLGVTPGTRALLELAIYRQQGGTRNVL